VSIDNQHQLTNTRVKIDARYRKDLLADKLIIKSMVWGAKFYLVTSFFETPVRRKDTFMFPPVVRKEVQDLKSKSGDYILVYQNSEFGGLAKALKSVDMKFVIFGMNKKGVEGNLEYKGYSEKEWLKYLAGCRAIIATAGLSLISEALYLNKPYLTVPVKKQTEQMINAKYLVDMGYGMSMGRSSGAEIKGFIDKLPTLEKNLKKRVRGDEMSIFRKIDQIISYFS
jgi:uncharacterized protein (TIGR00661 family)